MTTNRPAHNQFDRDQLDDFGLIDNDDTEDMRKPPAATEGSPERTNPTVRKGRFTHDSSA